MLTFRGKSFLACILQAPVEFGMREENPAKPGAVLQNIEACNKEIPCGLAVANRVSLPGHSLDLLSPTINILIEQFCEAGDFRFSSTGISLESIINFFQFF